jgi:hypothetical protein
MFCTVAFYKQLQYFATFTTVSNIEQENQMALHDIKTYSPREVSLRVVPLLEEVEDVGAAFIARRGRIEAILIPTSLQGILNALDAYEEFLDLQSENKLETLPTEQQVIIKNLKRILTKDLDRVRSKQDMFRESLRNEEEYATT